MNCNNLDKIVDRAIEAFGCKSKAQLAKLLGLSKQDLSNRIKRDTLTPLLIKEAVNHNVDLNWLITGQGGMRLGGGSTSSDRDLKSAEKTPPDESDIREKLRQLEARMILLERILTQSRPNPGRRFYDPLVAEKK